MKSEENLSSLYRKNCTLIFKQCCDMLISLKGKKKNPTDLQVAHIAYYNVLHFGSFPPAPRKAFSLNAFESNLWTSETYLTPQLQPISLELLMQTSGYLTQYGIWVLPWYLHDWRKKNFPFHWDDLTRHVEWNSRADRSHLVWRKERAECLQNEERNNDKK